jgi:glycosyltransferase involved in cell wall biosynthesis
MSQPPWPITSAPSATDPLFLPRRSPRRVTEKPARAESISRAKRTASARATDSPPIIAFCHLSWDWVWQRPQQFLSRFAQHHRILFVETYCSDLPETRVQLKAVDDHPNVTLAQMHLPAARWHDGQFIDAERRRALQQTLRQELRGQFEKPLLWFYDPMAVVAFAGHLDERAIIYDCMDELSQFRGAPPELIARERELLDQSDVVFCGGQKMRKKRLPLNPNTHFFGTGVDCTHFGRALADDLPIAPEIASLQGAPVLGYFGVIDERIDYELLRKLADARADWHVMMVGPTAKVNAADFPQRPNLHWLGARDYAQLPALTKGFAVAMMPFALNAATEYINPTKALEYMAAGRPVVSTALDEVRSNFGAVARIARSHAEFIALCDREVSKPSRIRIARGLRLAADNTWEAIVSKMAVHIADACTSNEATVSPAPAPILASDTLNTLAYV